MAADEQDTSRHAILQHAAHMQQQNSAALQEAQRLNAQLQESHERSRQQQAEEMARLIAQQQVERDNRDRMHQKVIEDLQKTSQSGPNACAAASPRQHSGDSECREGDCSRHSGPGNRRKG